MNLLDLARSALAERTPSEPKRATIAAARAHARLAAPAEAAQLRELVALVAAEWPEDQRAEALAVALADPADALTCYRALAADKPAHLEKEADDRRTCRQCANLSPGGRCLAAWRGESLGDGIATGRTYEPDRNRPHRCAAYKPRPDDADRRTGAERWPAIRGPREAGA